MKGVSRIDQVKKRTHGFFVRLMRDGIIHSAFFSDRKYGGKDTALNAAMGHYKTLLQKHGPVTRFSTIINNNQKEKPMKLNATVHIGTITPEMADNYLADLMEGQRCIRPRHVDRLANDMRSGNFKLSSDAIVLISGKLANGQHRLHAVAISGKPQQFLIMESNDNDLYKVIDCGIKRTVGDGLGLSDSAIPAIAKLVMAYNRGQITPAAGTANSRITHIEHVKFCEMESDLLNEAMSVTKSRYVKTKLLPVSIGGAAYFIGCRAGWKEVTTEFLTDVYERGGDGIAGELRNRLINNRASRAKLNQGYMFALCIKALSFAIRGERPKVLKIVDGEGIAYIPPKGTKV